MSTTIGRKRRKRCENGIFSLGAGMGSRILSTALGWAIIFFATHYAVVGGVRSRARMPRGRPVFPNLRGSVERDMAVGVRRDRSPGRVARDPAVARGYRGTGRSLDVE